MPPPLPPPPPGPAGPGAFGPPPPAPPGAAGQQPPPLPPRHVPTRAAAGAAALASLWSLGAKHRFTHHPSAFTDDLADAMRASLATGLDSFVAAQGDDWRAWADAFGLRLAALVAALPRGAPLTLGTVRAEPWVRFPSVDPTLKSFVRSHLQPAFAITLLDKASSTLVLSCKPAYARALCGDMANATVYVQHAAAPTPAALDAAAGAIASAFNTAAAAFGAKAGPERVGFYAGMPKLHKPRLGWRFLTCSFEVCTTPLARLLNTFLRALLPVCGEAWARAMQGVPSLPAESLPPWNQTSSADCIPAYRLFNSALMRWSTFEARGGMHTRDFERLYTNIPLADLKAVMAETVALCFKELGAPAGFLAFPALGMHNTHPCGPRGGTRFKGQTIWSAAQATAALHLLLDNTYVLWGGNIFRQVQGIPMGTNPAVFIASLYLFMYELRFMSRLAAAARGLVAILAAAAAAGLDIGYIKSEAYTAARAAEYFGNHVGMAALKPWAALHILRACGSNQRFVDDLFTIGNPYVDCLAYDTQLFCGFQGCYPAWLNLAAARAGLRDCSFLDLDVRADPVPLPLPPLPVGPAGPRPPLGAAAAAAAQVSGAPAAGLAAAAQGAAAAAPGGFTRACARTSTTSGAASSSR
jgi:hypothetical protein